MNKKRIFIMSFFQILFLSSIIKSVLNNNENTLLVSTTVASIIGTIIFVCIIIYIYIYILKKFLRLRKSLVYKIYLVLNILWIISIVKNFIGMIGSFYISKVININTVKISAWLTGNLKKDYIFIVNVIMIIFFIGNLILILTYNRNLRAIKKKEEPV